MGQKEMSPLTSLYATGRNHKEGAGGGRKNDDPPPFSDVIGNLTAKLDAMLLDLGVGERDAAVAVGYAGAPVYCRAHRRHRGTTPLEAMRARLGATSR